LIGYVKKLDDEKVDGLGYSVAIAAAGEFRFMEGGSGVGDGERWGRGREMEKGEGCKAREVRTVS
jgi:hypothetical protein